MSGLVRTWKQSKATRGLHWLERADVGTGQAMETKRGSEGTYKLKRANVGTGQVIARRRGELTT